MNRKVLNSYIKNLKKQGTHLLVRDNTLSLFAELQYAGHVVIKLMLDEDSNLEISEYIGMSNEGIRSTNKITRELEEVFRDYSFEIENFGYFQISLIRKCNPQSAEEIQEEVNKFLDAIDQCYLHYQQSMGANFCR